MSGSLEMCMSTQKNVVPSFAKMWPCSSTMKDDISVDLNDKIFYNLKSGQLVSISAESGDKKCLTPYSYDEANNAAAGLVMADCVSNSKDRNKHVKQRFHFSKTSHFKSGSYGRVLTGVQTTMCLALKSAAPLNSNIMQMWSKRLPGKEVLIEVDEGSSLRKISVKRSAIFIINSDKETSHELMINHQILENVFQMDTIRGGSLKIYDVWTQSVPLDEHKRHSSKSTQDAKEINMENGNVYWKITVSPRDSQFFILEYIEKLHPQKNHPKYENDENDGAYSTLSPAIEVV